jgi:hypothetical protein
VIEREFDYTTAKASVAGQRQKPWCTLERLRP